MNKTRPRLTDNLIESSIASNVNEILVF